MDFTTSTIPKFFDEGEVKCSIGLKRMLDEGVDISQITLRPMHKEVYLILMKMENCLDCRLERFLHFLRKSGDAILDEGISPEIALKVITENPANILKLSNKGNN